MIELTDPKIQKYLTPYRYEKPVLHGSGILGAFDEKAVDIPFVFLASEQVLYVVYRLRRQRISVSLSNQ